MCSARTSGDRISLVCDPCLRVPKLVQFPGLAVCASLSALLCLAAIGVLYELLAGSSMNGEVGVVLQRSFASLFPEDGSNDAVIRTDYDTPLTTDTVVVGRLETGEQQLSRAPLQDSKAGLTERALCRRYPSWPLCLPGERPRATHRRTSSSPHSQPHSRCSPCRKASEEEGQWPWRSWHSSTVWVRWDPFCSTLTWQLAHRLQIADTCVSLCRPDGAPARRPLAEDSAACPASRKRKKSTRYLLLAAAAFQDGSGLTSNSCTDC